MDGDTLAEAINKEKEIIYKNFESPTPVNDQVIYQNEFQNYNEELSTNEKPDNINLEYAENGEYDTLNEPVWTSIVNYKI